jgi:hypothetical protein
MHVFLPTRPLLFKTIGAPKLLKVVPLRFSVLFSQDYEEDEENEDEDGGEEGEIDDYEEFELEDEFEEDEQGDLHTKQRQQAAAAAAGSGDAAQELQNEKDLVELKGWQELDRCVGSVHFCIVVVGHRGLTVLQLLHVTGARPFVTLYTLLQVVLNPDVIAFIHTMQ